MCRYKRNGITNMGNKESCLSRITSRNTLLTTQLNIYITRGEKVKRRIEIKGEMRRAKKAYLVFSWQP